MDASVWLIIGLIAGGVTGGVATWLISRARGGAVSVMQLKQENDKFRNEVAEHFVETARLINEMTDSYKKVFDHLSSGAEKLVDDDKLAERLPPASGQEVRLGGFGAGSNAAQAGRAETSKPGGAKQQSGASRKFEADRSTSAPSSSTSESARPKSGGTSRAPEKARSAEKSAVSENAGTAEKTAENKAEDTDPLKRESGSVAGAKQTDKEGSPSSPTERSGEDSGRSAGDSEAKETRK